MKRYLAILLALLLLLLSLSSCLSLGSSGGGEGGSSDTEGGSGDTEDGSGDTEDGSGDTEDGSGDTEDGSGDTEDGSGDTEDGSGDTEDGSGDDNFDEGDESTSNTPNPNPIKCETPKLRWRSDDRYLYWDAITGADAYILTLINEETGARTEITLKDTHYVFSASTNAKLVASIRAKGANGNFDSDESAEKRIWIGWVIIPVS